MNAPQKAPAALRMNGSLTCFSHCVSILYENTSNCCKKRRIARCTVWTALFYEILYKMNKFDMKRQDTVLPDRLKAPALSLWQSRSVCFNINIKGRCYRSQPCQLKNSWPFGASQAVNMLLCKRCTAKLLHTLQAEKPFSEHAPPPSCRELRERKRGSDRQK